jgi:hypothetical protein
MENIDRMDGKHIKGRTCGNCVVCCVYPGIESPELVKPAMQHCPYLRLPESIEKNAIYYTGKNCENNCTVIGTDKRPKCCNYTCCWLQGFGDEEDRPDLSLILFDRTHKISNAIEAKPLVDNQEQTEEGRILIDKMSRLTGKLAIVACFGEGRIRRVVGRPVE